jgi:hypothetical protein
MVSGMAMFALGHADAFLAIEFPYTLPRPELCSTHLKWGDKVLFQYWFPLIQILY